MTTGPDPRVGTDLGPYRIEAVIGRGGMGVVYLAEQVKLGRKVALKVLAPGLASDAAFRVRFERESKMAAAIDDPNILPIHEAGEIDGELFIAMRYVKGTDLEQELADGPLEPAEMVHLLLQVASALDAAHARGLVHRDVKPANILIAPAPGDERGDHAYLTDFGLTKSQAQDTSLTRAGTLLGTLDSMAPEQIEGGEVGPAADEYALACVAYRCLTGRPPYVRDSDVALIAAHLKEPPPAVTALRPDLPAPVDAVLIRALAKDPAARYPTCSAFVAALREALLVDDVIPRAAPATQQVPRAFLGIAGAAMVVLFAGIVWVLLSAIGAGAGASPSAPASEAAASGVASPSAASPGGSGSDDFPNGAEAALIALLRPAIASDCQRGSYEVADFVWGPPGGHVDAVKAAPIASVRCPQAPGPGADVVEARQFATSSERDADQIPGATAARLGIDAGDCATSARALGSWTLSGITAGAITCYRDTPTGAAHLEWSYTGQQLLLRAERSGGDSAALYEWFTQNARFIAP